MSIYRSAAPPAQRVYVARWILVSQHVDDFRGRWLKEFAATHARSRVEGYVLDLTAGGLLAALDLADVAPEVYDDITLQIVGPEDDAGATDAFCRLIRDCNPTTASNHLSCLFDRSRWPLLSEACASFERATVNAARERAKSATLGAGMTERPGTWSPPGTQPSDVQRWAELLHSGAALDRLEGATELANLALRTGRSTVHTRGTISRPADARFPHGLSLSSVRPAFRDQHPEVRRAVVYTLGELADENAVTALSDILSTDDESDVRGYVVEALGKIAGPRAVSRLTDAARKDPSADVRIRAIRALTDLAKAEPMASQGIIDTLENVRREDGSDIVVAQAEEALTRMK